MALPASPFAILGIILGVLVAAVIIFSYIMNRDQIGDLLKTKYPVSSPDKTPTSAPEAALEAVPEAEANVLNHSASAINIPEKETKQRDDYIKSIITYLITYKPKNKPKYKENEDDNNYIYNVIDKNKPILTEWLNTLTTDDLYEYTKRDITTNDTKSNIIYDDFYKWIIETRPEEIKNYIKTIDEEKKRNEELWNKNIKQKGGKQTNNKKKVKPSTKTTKKPTATTKPKKNKMPSTK